jgi:hypothetical protein
VEAAGALAVSDDCRYGRSVNVATQDLARQQALDACNQTGGSNCRVVATLRTSCMAYFGDLAGSCKARGLSTQSDGLARLNEAFDKCESEGGRQCRVIAAACDTSGGQ